MIDKAAERLREQAETGKKLIFISGGVQDIRIHVRTEYRPRGSIVSSNPVPLQVARFLLPSKSRKSIEDRAPSGILMKKAVKCMIELVFSLISQKGNVKLSTLK